MRFVRAFVHPKTGRLSHVRECEVPFGEDDPPIYELIESKVPGQPHARTDFDMHELGLAEDFKLSPAIGSPAAHLFQRLEHVASAPATVKGVKRFRAKRGHEKDVPAFHDVPTTKAAILAAARADATAVPARVLHWLEYMGQLTEEELDGLPRLTGEIADEFDAIRTGRDRKVGPRADVHRRLIRERENSGKA